jgi:quercetin dioxygenase-like cupin family protein
MNDRSSNMTATVMPWQASAIHLTELMTYPQTGTQSKVLLEDASCRYVLMLMAAGTNLAEHTTSRNATLQVIEGQGLLTLEGQEIKLEPGLLAFMPNKARHALKAEENLAFLLTFSA